jgi:hypothetical protein
MYWKCEHCETTNAENVDYCTTCELCGCLPDEHYCEDLEIVDPA